MGVLFGNLTNDEDKNVARAFFIFLHFAAVPVLFMTCFEVMPTTCAHDDKLAILSCNPQTRALTN